MVSALLIGAGPPDLTVKAHDPVPLAFPHIPVCSANTETGCVIGFSSFRAEAPPVANTLFVKAPEGSHKVCANPAALAGGAGPLDAYFSTSGATIMAEAKTPFEWTNPARPIDTPFVKAPGLLSAACVDDGKVVYLAVSRAPSKDGRRAREITGDVTDPSGQGFARLGASPHRRQSDDGQLARDRRGTRRAPISREPRRTDGTRPLLCWDEVSKSSLPPAFLQTSTIAMCTVAISMIASRRHLPENRSRRISCAASS
jgi:hypothetical protein